MSYLKTRLKRLEDKTIGKKNGIPQWALEVAETEAKRPWIDVSTDRYSKPKPRPNIDVDQFAKDLAEKFTSREDYEKSLPPPDYSHVERLLNEIK